MSKVSLSLLLLLFISNIQVFAQANHDHDGRGCGTTHYHEQLMQDPDYRDAHENRQKNVQQYLAKNKSDEKRLMCDNTLLLPVAVHYQNTGLPIDCAIEMALDQIRILNEDFSATNTDINLWPPAKAAFFPNTDNQASCIQFCLATKEHPAGFGLQDGEYAVTLDQTMGDSDAAWNGYINFFVRDLGGGTLGYSPLGGTGNGMGIACTTTGFSSISCGGNNVGGQYDLGRTMTHEVGHYLNLPHPFDDSGADACADHDGIADTPNTAGEYEACPDNPTSACGVNALWPTYMEYCNDACLFMFTEGQVDVMEAHVNTNLQNLLNSSAIRCSEAACLGFETAANSTPESCDGNDGTIAINTTEGNEPFSFSINGGATFQAASNFAGITSGDYSIMVIDSENCEAETMLTVFDQQPPIAISNVQPAFCSFPVGSFEVAVNLQSDFEFSIDNGVNWTSDGAFSELLPDTYEVLAMGPGCTGSTFVTINDINELDVTFNLSPINCYAFDNGEININVGGGEAPFSFSLDGGSETNSNGTFSLLTEGQHSVVIQDDTGCGQTLDFIVERSFGAFDDDCPCSMYVPNAFTPDDDGINEYFFNRPSCPLAEYEFTIFDRWGNQIFLSNDPTEPWLGGGNVDEQYYAHPGPYNYRIVYKWGDDNGQQATSNIKTGYITVIR